MAPKRRVSSAANLTSSSSSTAICDLSLKIQRKSMGSPQSPVLIGNFTNELCQFGSFLSSIPHTEHLRAEDQTLVNNPKPRLKQSRRRSTLSQAFLNNKKRRSIKPEFPGNSSIESQGEQNTKMDKLQARGLWDTRLRGMISPKVTIKMPLENPRRRPSNVKRVDTLPFAPLEDVEEVPPNCDANLLLCRELKAKPVPDIDEVLRLISGETDEIENCYSSHALEDNIPSLPVHVVPSSEVHVVLNPRAHLIPSPSVTPRTPLHQVPTQRTPRVLRSRSVAGPCGVSLRARLRSPPRPPRVTHRPVVENTVAISNADKVTVQTNRSRRLQVMRNTSTLPLNDSGAKKQHEGLTSEDERRLQLKNWLVVQQKTYRRPPMYEEASVPRASAQKRMGRLGK